MTNRASLTAEYMALFRSLETSRPSGSQLFLDHDAPLFLSGWRKWLYRLARMPLGRRTAEKVLDLASPGARAAGIARTKWIDDEAAAALETATQLVLLGGASAAALLGMVSWRAGRSVKWDGIAALGYPAANKLLRRPYLAPWKYPES